MDDHEDKAIPTGETGAGARDLPSSRHPAVIHLDDDDDGNEDGDHGTGPRLKRKKSSILDSDSDLEITSVTTKSGSHPAPDDLNGQEGKDARETDEDEDEDDMEAMWGQQPSTPRPLSPGLPSIEVPSSPQTPSNNSMGSPPPTTPGRRASVQLQQRPWGPARNQKFFFSEREYKLFSVDAAAEVQLNFRKNAKKGLKGAEASVAAQAETAGSDVEEQGSESSSDSPSPEPVNADANLPPSLLVAEEHAIFIRFHQLLERGVSHLFLSSYLILSLFLFYFFYLSTFLWFLLLLLLLLLLFSFLAATPARGCCLVESDSGQGGKGAGEIQAVPGGRGREEGGPLPLHPGIRGQGD